MENLIGYAAEVMLELKLNQLQHHANARNAMMMPASYCDPAFMSSERWILFTSSYYMCFMSHIELLHNYVNYGTGGNFEVDHFKCINKQTYMYTCTHVHMYTSYTVISYMYTFTCTCANTMQATCNETNEVYNYMYEVYDYIHV